MGRQGEEWLSYGGSQANLKYSTLDQIGKNNVRQLKIVWRITPEVSRPCAAV